MLPLRGHREEDEDRNPGNFMAIMHMLALYEPVVNEILEKVKIARQGKKGSRVQASMTSGKIQNEIVSIIGEAILKDIVKDIKESGKCVIISDNNVEQLSIFNY